MYLFLVLFIRAAVPSMCKGPAGQPEKTCDVFPKDKYIEVGSNIDVVCKTSCVRGKILWKLNKSPVDESLSNTINSSHSVLTLRNFTHHSATLQCYSAETQLVLGGTNIRTYMKPSKLSCILHHGNQLWELDPDQLTCSWEHQIINSSLKINYTVLSAQHELCRSTNVTQCTYTQAESDQIDLLSENIITVRATTAAWEADSHPQTFNPYHIMKMIRPKVNVSAFSDRVVVEWKRPNINLECRCQVNYSKAVGERTPVLVFNETLGKRKHGITTIEEVESCSNYTFSVRCALVEAPWSDWSQKTQLTKLNKSHVKLRLWRTVAAPEKNGDRKVCAMWMEMPSTCQETFTHIIKQTPYREHMMGVNYTDTLCGKSTCDVTVDRDAHRIKLTVFHHEALLVEDSVYVPAIGESLPQVTDIQASALEGVILVSWNAPIQPVSGYMIDWTDGGNQYFWKETKYTNATLSDLLDKKPYNITVTPLFSDKTGEGTQALNICSRVADPGNVTIHQVQANDKTALVSWSVKSQEACSGIIVSYTVFYSIQDGPQLNVTVDGSEQVTSLKDLNPDTQYSVYVKATAGTGSTQSSETLFKTKRFGPGLVTTVVACGSIVIMLVLCLGLCFAVQWKKFRENPVPNPGQASSVTVWPAPSCQERMFQAFKNPSESICDRIYTEETPIASTSPPDPGCNGDPVSDQTEENVDPTILQPPHEKNKDPGETRTCLSADDSTALLTSENHPYRSQTPVQSPVSRSSKQCKRAPVKQPEKTAAAMLYVTLDMFEQGVNGNATITTVQDLRCQ